MKAIPLILFLGFLAAFSINSLKASQAFGSINNFDAVNDTGSNCHGFEIELDGIHSKDITYTYDWNHYGTPVISEDNTDTNNPKVFVVYRATFTNNSWSAYTAVPASPIAPTMGHQFTDPSTNFGGEHFGVGYSGVPTNIRYNWLQDDGTGSLILGPAVSVSTPVFSYAPAEGTVPAQVQAVIDPPLAPFPEVNPREFGFATWVKEIRTTTHTNNPVELRDLVSPDTNFPTMYNWAAGEPVEVESEWTILQTDAANANAANNKLIGAAEPLNNGDEVVTRRYEFYKYTGPLDPQTGKALADSVSLDGTNGVGQYSNTVVVGNLIGVQMSAADAAGHLGLIDHLPDGEVGTNYPDRTVVIVGTAPFTSTLTNGTLPPGMSFDPLAGVISGTPQTNGDFAFTITATDGVDPDVSNNYILTVAKAGEVPAAHSIVEAVAVPSGAGVVAVAPQGVVTAAVKKPVKAAAETVSVIKNIAKLTNGASANLTAAPAPGYVFVGWSEAGISLTNSTNYSLVNIRANHELIAKFTKAPILSAVQTITFPEIPAQQVINRTVLLGATASSKLPVSYSVTPSKIASVTGNILTLTGAGIVNVTATQAGNGLVKPANAVRHLVVVSKSLQKITFPKIKTTKLTAGMLLLSATADSNQPVTYKVLTPSTALVIGNWLILKTYGLVVVQATQTGTDSYLPAAPATVSFRVTPGFW